MSDRFNKAMGFGRRDSSGVIAWKATIKLKDGSTKTYSVKAGNKVDAGVKVKHYIQDLGSVGEGAKVVSIEQV